MARAKLAVPELFRRAEGAAARGDPVEAERLYREILAARPDQPRALQALSILLYQHERHEEALSLIDRLVARRPDLAGAHYTRGTMLQNLGHFEPALASLDNALSLTPNDRHALQNRGVCLASLRRFEAAVATYDRLIALDRNSVDGHLARGYALYELGRFADALASYDRAVALQPDHPVAHNVRGNTLRELRRYPEALAGLDRALSLNPDYAEARLNRGNVLRDLGRYDEALASFDRAQPSAADLPAAVNGRGLALQELRRFPEAIASFDRAIELAPANADFRVNRALLALLLGNYATGWREYEWRRKQKTWRDTTFDGAEWGGAAIAGKRVFLYTEQGLGDAIQFARFAPAVAALGAKVDIGAPPLLDGLLRSIGAGVEIVRHGELLPPYDFHLPLMSVPVVLATTETTIPAAVPYLHADPALAAAWWERLRHVGDGLRVGFRWAGGSTFIDEHHRSTAFARWRPVLEIPGVVWYSLQTEARAAEFASLPGIAIRDLSAELTDFTQTAAIIANLDLVITTDTAVAHLAGAMGRPVWIALKHVPDWRWLLDREDSPWYPSARLFRQRRAGDWDELIARIAVELAKLGADRRALARSPAH